MQKTLGRIIKISIYSLVFLLPLFFLPFNFEAFEYNKQYLLFFLTTLGFFAWLVKMVLVDKEIRFRRTPLNLFVLAFLFVAVLSAIFSVDKSSSLFGFYGRFANGLIGLLSLGMLYFLVTNNTRSEINRQGVSVAGLLKTFLWSSSLIVLTSLLSIFGVLAKISVLPQVMRQRTFNPAAGSLEGLSIFLAVLLVFVVGIILTQKFNSKIKSLSHWLLLVAILFLLLIIDFTPAWTMILITLVLFVALSLWKRIFQENVNRLLIPILLIMIAGIAIPFQPQNITLGGESILTNLPREQVLNQRTSWSIGFDSAVDNVKSGFLGSGIGTFHYDFAKEKPIEINQSWLWQIRFDRAGTYLAEILGTMGFLGLLSYLGMIIVFLMTSYFLVARIKSIMATQPWQLPLLLFFWAAIASQFVYYQNTTLSFVFWLVLALAVVSWQQPLSERVISFKNFQELALVFSTLVLIFGAVILTSYYFAVNFYLADVNYVKGLFQLGQERVQTLEKTVNLNPYFPRYRTALARTYLSEGLQEMAQPVGQQDALKIQNMVARAIDEARMATTLQPNLVANWETLGVIYREIGAVAAGSLEWGIQSFETALMLEPTNPVLYTELGKLYLVAGDSEKAKESFNQAIEKKSDYADALIQQALLLEREDILDEAVQTLEGLLRGNPFNIEALFQLGRLYFNNGQVTEAVARFETAIILAPNHSNAHYSLGVAYITQGKKELAIQEFEKVLALNPGNQDVIQKLNDLRKLQVE